MGYSRVYIAFSDRLRNARPPRILLAEAVNRRRFIACVFSLCMVREGPKRCWGQSGFEGKVDGSILNISDVRSLTGKEDFVTIETVVILLAS